MLMVAIHIPSEPNYICQAKRGNYVMPLLWIALLWALATQGVVLPSLQANRVVQKARTQLIALHDR